MMFHVSYQVAPENRDAVQKRFKETGAPPPAGVTMIGRWHCAQQHAGFLVADSEDAEAIARWTHEWSDIMTFKITPVINDEQLARVLG